MKDKDIESILRDSRPQVRDNPAFLLEVQQKMRAVDRQRRYGRNALILTLVSGLLLGAVAMSLACLYPIDTTAISDGVLSDIRVFLESYKQYLLLPVAGCAISLGVIFAHKT